MAAKDSKKLGRWSRAVRERDRCCQVCGSIQQLTAHHLESQSSNESLRYELDNGITMCNGCHVAFHIRFGGKTTRKQFLRFQRLCAQKGA